MKRNKETNAKKSNRTRDGGVSVSAAQHFLGDILLSHSLDHIGARHEHVRSVLDLMEVKKREETVGEERINGHV